MQKEDIQDHYKEIEHTADIAIEVTASTFSGLLHQAGIGMLHLLGLEELQFIDDQLDMEFAFAQREDILVQALSEVLFQIEANELVYLPINAEIHDTIARVHYVGISLTADLSEIKAVTYHQMQIVEDENGMHTIIVFDV
jgi:SHS2 domain-containing protein